MFYRYSQNNSGGGFDFEAGKLTHHVIIEAPSAKMADARLEELGGYFDGCESGRDCDCCGDRWSTAYGDGDAVPTLYGQDVSSGVYKERWGGFMKDKPEGYVHYLDGRVVPVVVLVTKEEN